MERRTDRYWAGLSSDLVIEQVLMRSMKSTGRLTRGRGMCESERTQLMLSISACADLNGAMQKLTSTTFMTSEQHEDVTKARKARDDKYSYAILGISPGAYYFVPDPSLRNSATGVVADVSVKQRK